ncbi:MAG: ATP-dependent zinc protease [Bacteroidetes bacterium]|nr:ATP-dependent zinc protease [Bacteroidota bacterium]
MDIIGRREMIHLPEWGGFFIPAKIDTGAFRTAVHCDSYIEKEKDGITILEVTFTWEDQEKTHVVIFDKFKKRIIKNSFGQTEERYCVRTPIKIGQRTIQSEVTLTNRSDMKYPVLLGRKTIGKKFLVDVSNINLNTF